MNGRLIYGLGSSKNLIFNGESFLKRVIDCGINQFDVAPIYGAGLGELLLGKIANTNRISVTTKMGIENWRESDDGSISKAVFSKILEKLAGARSVKDYSEDSLQKSLLKSIARLGDGFIEKPVFLLHEFYPLDPNSAIHLSDFLKELKNENLISNYGLATTKLQDYSLPPVFPIIQTNFEYAIGITQNIKYRDCEVRAFGLFKDFSKLDALEQKARIRAGRIFLDRNSMNKIVIGTSKITHIKFAIEQLNE
jgi:hypothetical protein